MTRQRPGKPATAAPAEAQKPGSKPKERPAKPSAEKPEMKVPPVAIPSKSKPRADRPDPKKVAEKFAPPSAGRSRPEMQPKRPDRTQTTPHDQKADDKVGRRKAAAPASKETKKVLQESVHRDRRKDVEQALRIDDRSQASDLVRSILGQVTGGPGAVDRRPSGPGRDQHLDDDHHGYGRLPSDQVGRSTREREQSVDFLIRRFAGGASLNEAPEGFYPGRDGYRTDEYPRDHQTHYHGPDNRQRVVCYPSRNDIPAILLASVVLNRVQAQPFAQSSYRPGQPSVDDGYYRNIPQNYQSEDAYAVSYSVDPESVISREDIIFQQGSSAFADAYSYDLVVDLAEAMKAPELQNEKFVIEGHASAEGDYESNLRLSQERAERISRDLVNLGVAPDQLLPVGYGEAEAQYPGDAREPLRSLDRRVVVFRMADE